MDKLLRLASLSLVNLCLVLDSFGLEDVHEVVKMLRQLPAFPTLDTLSLALNDQAEHMLEALQSIPKLTRLNLRIILGGDSDNEIREDFREILSEAFPWGGSRSMKSALTQKCPLLRQIGIFFCVSRTSTMHFRRGSRARMERELTDCLDETRADLSEYLQVGWLDSEFNPILYSKTNGKPQNWKLPEGFIEPETEGSDAGEWETDSNDEGDENDW
ncbi:hypothetical protein K438DRAFT_1799605 [Mycena galopus ATCC 62051]|nr:hypothetical protein K438DRAFT_1799605 [Mycena galopus ATCC 62051]